MKIDDTIKSLIKSKMELFLLRKLGIKTLNGSDVTINRMEFVEDDYAKSLFVKMFYEYGYMVDDNKNQFWKGISSGWIDYKTIEKWIEEEI